MIKQTCYTKLFYNIYLQKLLIILDLCKKLRWNEKNN